MLVWHSSYFVGCSRQEEKKNNEEKKKSYAHSIFISLVFGISMVCRLYHGLIVRGHFGLRDLFLF